MAEAQFTFSGTDGHKLLVHVWETADTPKALVLLSHGYGEHAGRYADVAARLTAAGYLVVAPDHQGHGRSEGPRGQISFATAVADLDALISHQRAIHPDLPVFLLGHSAGGAAALRYAIAHPDRLSGMVLSSPLVRTDAHPLVKLAGTLMAKVLPSAPVLSLDPALISRDPSVVAAYTADPLVRHRPIPAATGAEFIRHADSIMDDAQRITTPTLLLWGTADRLCPPAGAEALAGALGAEDLSTHPYPGLYHEIFNEPEREAILATVVAWLNAHV